MNVTVDEGTTSQIGPVDIVFQAGDSTQAQVIDRINNTLGYTAVSDAGGNTTTAVGRIQGLAGNFKINSLTALVGTATGFVVGTTAGTGDVQDISQVTSTEIAALVLADTAGAVSIQKTSGSFLRACNLNSAAGQTIEVHANTTAVGLGFTVGDSASNSTGTDGVLPAGTRVRNAGGDEWVTMQSTPVEAGNPGPYTIRVRPADDDGTATAAATGTINVMPFPADVGSFAVSNLLPVSAALTEGQLDARYVEAIGTTLNPNAVSRQANLIFSARQSQRGPYRS